MSFFVQYSDPLKFFLLQSKSINNITNLMQEISCSCTKIL